MGKLKQLTKSRSIEETGTANQLVNAGIQVEIQLEFDIFICLPIFWIHRRLYRVFP